MATHDQSKMINETLYLCFPSCLHTDGGRISTRTLHFPRGAGCHQVRRHRAGWCEISACWTESLTTPGQTGKERPRSRDGAQSSRVLGCREEQRVPRANAKRECGPRRTGR